MAGVKFDEKHTEKDWGLIWTDLELSTPEAKQFKIQVPGADGDIDLTEYLTGDVKYENRALQFTFVLDDRDMERWHNLYTTIVNYLHGKRMKIILDTDPGYYYLGRVSCELKKEDAILGSYLFTCDVEPYKYELQSSLEDWLWDPFNFEDGIVREYKNLTVNGSRSVLIPARRKKVVPVITCSAAMSVTYQGKTYPLKAGANKLYDLSLPEGENTLVFNGQGTVSIDYQGGSL